MVVESESANSDIISMRRSSNRKRYIRVWKKNLFVTMKFVYEISGNIHFKLWSFSVLNTV